METLKTIATRRSIRKFKATAVPEELLEKLLRAAMDAPSALDEQPWQFLVITEAEALKKIPENHSHSDLVAQAPMAILVCADLDREKLPGFWVQDCSAATQNLLLAAHDQGLGAVWIGVYPTKENVKGLQQQFQLPENIIPFSLIAVGYPDEPYPEKQNFRTSAIHRATW